MLFTYILECRDGTYYVGSTWQELGARVDQHNAKQGSAYTKRRTPVRLVWAAEFESVEDAFRREKQIQGWGRAKRQALIDGRLEDLPRLSRSKSG